MGGRDIKIPFGPDKTGGIPLDAIPTNGEEELPSDPFAEPAPNPQPRSLADSLPGFDTEISPTRESVADAGSYAQTAAYDPVPNSNAAVDGAAANDGLPSNAATMAAEPTEAYRVPVSDASSQADGSDTPELSDRSYIPSIEMEAERMRESASASSGNAAGDSDYHPGGLTDEEATSQGMDEMQMSILALKDSIGQGRELKEREKEREELAEALEADHIELADRENILANYQSIIAEQDALIAERTQRRDAAKAELSQLTMAVEQAQAELSAMREQHAAQLQPLETDLGRARAAADQAKNDERSRKSELNAAESELRKSGDSDANTMAVARHVQVKAAYDEARMRSEQAKEQLSQIQRAYDEAKQRSEQSQGPLERTIEDYENRMASLKESVSSLGEEISAALNRRQYCDTVYQFPDETAMMRSEIEQAEALARQMDAENDALREQLAESKQKARKAKVAIGLVIVIVIVIIIAFIVVSGR